MSLTLAFVVDAALRLGLKFGLDVVQQLVEALGRANLRAPHHAGWWVSVVHRGGFHAIECGSGVETRLGLCAIGVRRAG